MSAAETVQQDATTREVTEREHEGRPRRVVAATRTFAASPDEIWDAITQPERLARWFLTVTGDLRLGGRFQLKDTASGTVNACRASELLAVTWEAFGDVSWVEVHLSTAPGGGTVVRVEHLLSGRLGDRLFWWWFGAGATGIGWELGLLGLEQYLSTGPGYALPTDLSSADLQRWRARSAGKDFLEQASGGWCQAEITGGAKAAAARKRAARSYAFYGRGLKG